MNHRKTTTTPILRMRVPAVVLCLGTLFILSRAAQSQTPQATPLPLSGRTGQSGSVTAVESPIAGTTTSVDTINPTVQVQGPFSGSASSTARMPFSGKLSLREAIARGLNYNLGAVGQSSAVRQAQGQSQVARSALLPNASGYLAETLQQISLTAEGLRISIPGFAIPPTIGPFNNIDLRGSLTQSIFDLSAWNNYRSSRDVFRASKFAARDAREMVVLAVCGAYLQVIATKERVKSAHAQLDTATALFQQTQQKRSVGLVPQIDVDRSEVEELTQQQRVISLENEVAKQKIILARMTGLPPSDEYDLTDDVPWPRPILALRTRSSRPSNVVRILKRPRRRFMPPNTHLPLLAMREFPPLLSTATTEGSEQTLHRFIRHILARPLSMFRFGWEAARREKSQRQRPL